MEFKVPQTRKVQPDGSESTGKRSAAPGGAFGNRRMEAVQTHPLAELLQCPPETGLLLNGSAQCLGIKAGERVFRQGEICRGLFVVVSGQFQRRTERLKTQLTLAAVRAGELVELAAALGDGHHTYTLTAQSAGSLLLLPIEALHQAFQSYPPLRMQLLEELAREVSRAYTVCCLSRAVSQRRTRSAA
jgi:CRP-like cAMP-binding protein